MIYTARPAAQSHTSDLHFLVELRGFEPLTPSMRTRCATGLRYSPWNGCQRSKHSRVFAHSPAAGATAARAGHGDGRPDGGAGCRGSVSDGSVGRVGVLVIDLIGD